MLLASSCATATTLKQCPSGSVWNESNTIFPCQSCHAVRNFAPGCSLCNNLPRNSFSTDLIASQQAKSPRVVFLQIDKRACCWMGRRKSRATNNESLLPQFLRVVFKLNWVICAVSRTAAEDKITVYQHCLRSILFCWCRCD